MIIHVITDNFASKYNNFRNEISMYSGRFVENKTPKWKSTQMSIINRLTSIQTTPFFHFRSSPIATIYLWLIFKIMGPIDSHCMHLANSLASWISGQIWGSCRQHLLIWPKRCEFRNDLGHFFQVSLRKNEFCSTPWTYPITFGQILGLIAEGVRRVFRPAFDFSMKSCTAKPTTV